MMHPTEGPWDSPQVVTRNMLPNVLILTVCGRWWLRWMC